MKRLTLMLFAFAFLVTCKKNDSTNNNQSLTNPPPPPSNPIYELTTNTFEIDTATLSTIQSVDSTTIIFRGNTHQLRSLKTGNIIISGVAKNVPFGFLRKIANIQISSNTYTITTTEVPLTDAFKELHVDYTKSYFLGDTLKTKRALTTFSINMPNIVLFDVDGKNTTTSDQIKVNGNLTLTPEIHVKIDIGLNGVLPTLTYAKFECGFESVVNQTVTAGGSLGSVSKKINIFSKPLALFIIPGTPLVVVPNLRVSLGAEGSVIVDILASEVNTVKINSYLEYNNSLWDKGYTQTMQNQYSFSGLNGYANAKVYIEPAIDFKLYNSNWAKGSITAQTYLKASGQISPTPGCALRAGVSAGAEANLQFFAWSFTAASYPSIFDFSKVLYTCSSNNQAPTIATTDITKITTTSSSSGGNITADGGFPVTARGVCWSKSANPNINDFKTSDGTGTGTFKSSLTGLTPNTIYYLRAYATNSAGTSYGNNISFSTLSNNNDSTTGQPSKDPNCKENGTGDFCFQNNTGLDLELTLSSSPSKVQSYTPPYVATLKPGQKQCFFGVPAGPAGYEIKTPATYNGYGNQSQLETYLATGYVYVDQCRENTFFINTGSPSYSTNDPVFSGGNTNATSKDLNCKENETADFYFQNSTDMELNVTLMTSPSKQYSYTPPYLCIIQPGQQQGFFNVPAGPATYEIKTPATYTGGSGNSPDTYFAKGSLYVDQCKANIFVIKK